MPTGIVNRTFDLTGIPRPSWPLNTPQVAQLMSAAVVQVHAQLNRDTPRPTRETGKNPAAIAGRTSMKWHEAPSNPAIAQLTEPLFNLCRELANRYKLLADATPRAQMVIWWEGIIVPAAHDLLAYTWKTDAGQPYDPLHPPLAMRSSDYRIRLQYADPIGQAISRSRQGKPSPKGSAKLVLSPYLTRVNTPT